MSPPGAAPRAASSAAADVARPARLDGIIETLEAAAGPEETGEADIGASIEVLRRVGWLSDDGTADPESSAGRLRRVAAANLSVGRLWEGHMNALYLARTHGSPAAAGQVAALLRAGAFFGVWGADGPEPVTPAPDGSSLQGQKMFASGLGTVTHAIVTVSSGPDVRLALIGVEDMARADASVWKMQGMRATRSGRYDFDGIADDDILWLGDPGDYLTEPHFVGGVWRIAALQVGAALGLLDAAAGQLRARGRLDAPAQMARLSEVVIRALGGSALTVRAAQTAADCSPNDAQRAAALSAGARLLTEEVALDAIRAVEQCLGLAHFEQDSVTGRKARDLAVYLRQAARDAFQLRVGEACFARKGDLWTMF